MEKQSKKNPSLLKKFFSTLWFWMVLPAKILPWFSFSYFQEKGQYIFVEKVYILIPLLTMYSLFQLFNFSLIIGRQDYLPTPYKISMEKNIDKYVSVMFSYKYI